MKEKHYSQLNTYSALKFDTKILNKLLCKTTNLFLFLQNQTCFIKEVPFRSANCSDAAGRQVPYSTIVEKFLPNATSGRMWDPQQQSPYFNFKVTNEVKRHITFSCLFVCLNDALSVTTVTTRM
jgi:hypothetical protein